MQCPCKMCIKTKKRMYNSLLVERVRKSNDNPWYWIMRQFTESCSVDWQVWQLMKWLRYSLSIRVLEDGVIKNYKYHLTPSKIIIAVIFSFPQLWNDMKTLLSYINTSATSCLGSCTKHFTSVLQNLQVNEGVWVKLNLMIKVKH